MAADTTLTVIGNLTAPPELRYTPAGTPVANFTVASTPRKFDPNVNEWKDGEALFLRCVAWRDLAENTTESLTRGSRVIVSGRLKQHSYTTREGEKRQVVELEVDEVGPSLRYATATVVRTGRRADGGADNGFGHRDTAARTTSTDAVAAATTEGSDPWASATPARDSGGWSEPALAGAGVDAGGFQAPPL
ncbi:single-stranded DNA-binding protein [Nocardia sp. NPDC050378]|uniref:single-stranded DNA-binding protein n=1 Tax=Nocardia sp. NPDC050378 TaxID=3155400 RepID=UPI0033EC53AA